MSVPSFDLPLTSIEIVSRAHDPRVGEFSAMIRHPPSVRASRAIHGFSLCGFASFATVFHGFADSPVALFRHPLRGLAHLAPFSTGSQPPFSTGSQSRAVFHGFADSPVALFRHPLRGFAHLAPFPTGSQSSTGSQTHPWLYSVTHFVGSRISRRFPRVRSLAPFSTGSQTHPWLYSVTHFAGSGIRCEGARSTAHVRWTL